MVGNTDPLSMGAMSRNDTATKTGHSDSDSHSAHWHERCQGANAGRGIYDAPMAALERDPTSKPGGALDTVNPAHPQFTTDESHRKESISHNAPPSLSLENGLSGTEDPQSARGHLEGRGWAFKALFVITTCSAQLIAQGQFGMVVVPLYEVGEWLGTEEQGQLGWMAASYG